MTRLAALNTLVFACISTATICLTQEDSAPAVGLAVLSGLMAVANGFVVLINGDR